MSADATAGLLRAPVRPASRTERDRIAAAVHRRAFMTIFTAHVFGAIDVFVLLMWVLPTPPYRPYAGQLAVNVIAFAACAPLGGWAGWRLGERIMAPAKAWLRTDRAPTAAEQRAVLRQPILCTAIDGGLWVVAAAVFAAINAPASIDLAGDVGSTILLGGLTTCAVAYLVAERVMRPVTALVLANGPSLRSVGPGVKGRLVLSWLLATGVPLLGLLMVACHVLFVGHVSPERTAVSVLVLGVGALAVGLLAAVFSAKSVADPVGGVRRAMARVEAGELDVTVPVDDGSEVGLLQAGFNRMAAGLREREVLRDLFGRHVGEDVARQAVEGGDVRLGGELRDVGVLFVDLVGSTGLAARQTPGQVVALLNRFFDCVVAVVDGHGGWVNKFQGDGALCVFGAPVWHPDAPGAALAAARELRECLARELPELDAGIGVSAGASVAGNVGAEARFEYTVIGDPVNEAARLCDLAKRAPARVLASEAVLERTADEERARWRLGELATLRGRETPTRVASPGVLDAA